MKITFHSAIHRYEGEYASLSAFLLSPSHKESDKEEVHLDGVGMLVKAPDGFSLSYTEKEGGTKVRVSYRADTLSFTRGATSAQFSLGKSTEFSHETGYGALSQTVRTQSITVRERDGKYLLTLEYLAHFSGMVQKNKMMWKIEP